MSLLFRKQDDATIEEPFFLYGAVDLPPIQGVLVHVHRDAFTTATHAGQEWYFADGGTHWVLQNRIESPAGWVVGDIKKLFPK